MKSAGGRIPHCDTRRLARKAKLYLPEELAGALSPLVSTMADVDARIRVFDEEIAQMAQDRYPQTLLSAMVCARTGGSASWNHRLCRWASSVAFRPLAPRMDLPQRFAPALTASRLAGC